MINKVITALGLCFSSCFFTPAHAQNAVNYLQTNDAIVVDNQVYHLAFSNVTNGNHYKQEYITKQENLDNFTSMVTVDFFAGNHDVRKTLDTTIQQLEGFKKTNPMIHYAVYSDDSNNFLLDCIITDHAVQENATVVERNVYHYAKVNTKNTKGVMLVGISERAYGTNIKPFLAGLNARRNTLLQQVGELPLPTISPIIMK